jgi:hypothetical protein
LKLVKFYSQEDDEMNTILEITPTDHALFELSNARVILEKQTAELERRMKE